MIPLNAPLADLADRFAAFLRRHALDLDRVSAHLRLDILTPREAWVLRKFSAIAGGAGFIDDLRNYLINPGPQTIVPQVATATVTGTAVDMTDADGPCFGLLVAGAVSGGTTAATLAVKYTECATAGGTFADIAGAVHATVSASNKSELIRFMRSQRFIKAVGTMAGTAPSIAFTACTFGQRKAF